MNLVERTDRKFFAQQRNGDDFGDNETDFSTSFKYDILERCRVTETYLVRTVAEATSLKKFTVTTEGALLVINSPIPWSTEGIAFLDDVVVRRGTSVFTGTISFRSGGTLKMTTSTGTPLADLSAVEGDELTDLIIKVTSRPNGAIFKFGLSESVSSATVFSLLDGQEQAYSRQGLPTGSFVPLNYLSTSSSNLGSVQIRYVGASGTDSEVFEFELVHNFRIPHLKPSWAANYEDDTKPIEFAGTNTYNYQSSIIFARSITNSSTFKSFVSEFEGGSIGYYDEVFNTNVHNYTINTLDYGSAETIVVGETTTVNVEIERNSGTFNINEKFILYHAILPEPFDYQSNSNTFASNFIYSQAFGDLDGVSVGGGVISNCTATIDGGDASILDVSFDITYSSTQQGQLSNNDRIVLAIGLETSGTSNEDSDREVVKIDFPQVEKSSDVSGLASKFNATFKQRGSAFSAATAKVWNASLMEMDFNFVLNKTAGEINPFLTGLKFELVSWNPTTDDSFPLNTYNYSFSAPVAVIVGGAGYQGINVDTERDLPVPIGDEVREVNLTAEIPSSFTSTQTVSGKVGFMVPWQEWKNNPLVADEFYDGSLTDEFFNRNFRTSNYSGENGYGIYVFLTASVSYAGENTNYRMRTEAFEIYDFNEDGAATGWAHDGGKIYNELGGEVSYLDRITSKRVEFILSNPDVDPLTLESLRGEIMVEPTNNLGRIYRLNTNLDWSEDSNPVKPNTGESFVTKSKDNVADTVTLSATIDGELLEDAPSYNIYFELYE